MGGNVFEWDPNKDRRNLLKHGVSFTLASAVFEDPEELTQPARTVENEQRWQTIGRAGTATLFVVHTLRMNADGALIIRIISARLAFKAERSFYERSKP